MNMGQKSYYAIRREKEETARLIVVGLTSFLGGIIFFALLIVLYPEIFLFICPAAQTLG